MNVSHVKYLTPKSAYTFLESHSKLLDIQIKENLFKLVNFEIKVNWQPTPPVVVLPKYVKRHKFFKESNAKTASIYAFESTNGVSVNEMQADSKATMSHSFQFSIFSTTIVILFFLI